MKIRNLTRETLQKYLVYIPETGLFIRRIDSGKAKAGDIAGSIDFAGYCYIRVQSIRYAAHQLAWLYVYGEYPENELDHINGIKHDNRKENLRLATKSQNMANISRPTHNTSGFKGVCFDKANNKWMAMVQINKKIKHLGRFSNIVDAAAAYDKAAKDAFGEFARVNEVPSLTIKENQYV